MPVNKFCSCGKLIPKTERCECKKQEDRMRNKLRRIQNPEEKKFFNSKEWKDTRKSVIKRDGGVCQRCLIKSKGVITTNNLEVHHIKPRVKYNGKNGYPDLRYDESNLITLCKSCNTHLYIREELDFNWEVPDEWQPVL